MSGKDRLGRYLLQRQRQQQLYISSKAYSNRQKRGK